MTPLPTDSEICNYIYLVKNAKGPRGHNQLKKAIFDKTVPYDLVFGVLGPRETYLGGPLMDLFFIPIPTDLVFEIKTRF